MADYKKLKDTYGFGKRVLAKIKKDPNFLKKVEKNRSRNPYHYGEPELDYPCIGPCVDDAGNPVWVTSTKGPWNANDFNKWLEGVHPYPWDESKPKYTGTGGYYSKATPEYQAWSNKHVTVDDIAMDPMMYADHDNPIVRELASAMMNGYTVEDVAKNLNLHKAQVLHNDGGISRRASYPGSTNDKMGKSAPGSVIYGDGYDMRPNENAKAMKPKKEKGYIAAGTKKVTSPYSGEVIVEDFVNPTNVPGSKIKNNAVSTQSWNKSKVKGKERYNILNEQGTESPADLHDRKFIISHNKPSNNRYSDPYHEWGYDANGETKFMYKARKKADDKRAEETNAKWDAIEKERRAEYDKKVAELRELQAQLKKLEAEKSAAYSKYSDATSSGSDRKADLQKVYKYPDHH